ncbi:ABC transporter permease [Rubripirellula reticaptiva]|uniref:ABC-2 family transporter protein n=1 Tax=Rubripirellula reticaptiva TaxID=2528013 RepID=A0A5C6EDA9_9BACT|nr:ABC transporter permease [Rubripirellula reticaptiva]TWU47683.1 hypothetical protein Poly59_45240 [Rubripirellula reticaptiva]
MNASRVWQSLCWKDLVTIRPLLLAVGLAILALPIIAALASMLSDDRGRSAVAWSVMMWILLPNLMAIGLPPMLIGTEEENGTLGWLRTLPVRWQSVADTKFAIALVCMLSAWVLASVALWLSTWTWQDASSENSFGGLLTTVGIGQAFFFTCLLLMVGLVTSYAIKSPVAGLVSLLPVISIAWYFAYWMMVYLLDSPYASSISQIGAPVANWIRMIVACALVLVALFALQRWLARYRLSKATLTFRNPAGGIMREDAYRPPPVVVSGLFQPTPVYAMLWQQWRQVCVIVASLFSITFVFVLVELASSYGYRGRVRGGVIPLATLSFLWMGAVTFYGDSVRQQCRYFADRGISHRMVWWTRVLPTLVPALLLLAFLLLSAPRIDGPQNATQERAFATVYLMCCYAFGQLVSMWVKRPVLSFFAAPAYGMFASFVLVWFFIPYAHYVIVILLMVPILLIATRRLTGRWLEGRIDRGFHWRVIGWTGMAVAVPMLLVFGLRWWTTPPVMTDWRARMMAVNLPTLERPATRWEGMPSSTKVSAEAMQPLYYVNVDVRADISQRLKNELKAEDSVGRHVSFAELRSVVERTSRGFVAASDEVVWNEEFSVFVPPEPTEAELKVAFRQRDLAVEVLLKWANLVRQYVADGEEGLLALIRIAEPAEEIALQVFASQPRIKSVGSDKLLAAMFPSPELRKKSRRIGVIGEWQRYNRRGWFDRDPQVPIKDFAGELMLNSMSHKFAIERNRADRNIDSFVRRLVDMIDDDGYGDTDAIAAMAADWGRAKRGSMFDEKQPDYYANDPLIVWIASLRPLPNVVWQGRVWQGRVWQGRGVSTSTID